MESISNLIEPFIYDKNRYREFVSQHADKLFSHEANNLWYAYFVHTFEKVITTKYVDIPKNQAANLAEELVCIIKRMAYPNVHYLYMVLSNWGYVPFEDQLYFDGLSYVINN